MERHCGEEPSSSAEDVLELQGSSEVCCRCDRGVEGGGGSASRISSEPLLVRYVDGQADR